MKKIIIATRNKSKFEEMSTIFKTLDAESRFELLNLSDFPDLPADFEVVETGTTYEENAILKAKGYGDKIGELVLADDSGLEVDVLEGRPGIYSARYGPADWPGKCAKLLAELKDIPKGDRGAQFVCVMAIYDPSSGKIKICTGIWRGRITKEAMGESGFGFDPVFYSNELKMTSAEMSPVQKNVISHRFHALSCVYKILLENFAS